jgi:hypothetical protein
MNYFLIKRAGFTRYLNASLAQIRMLAVGSDARPIVPAPLAFIVTALFCHDCSFTNCLLQFYLADDTKCRKLLKAEFIQNAGIFIITADSNTCLLIACNLFLLSQTFQDP